LSTHDETKPILRNPDLIWRDEPEEKDSILAALERGEEIGDLGWVIIVDGGVIHQLNLLAGEIWLLCDGNRDEDAVVSFLAEQYEAQPEEIRGDVREFVSDCRSRGWILEEEK